MLNMLRKKRLSDRKMGDLYRDAKRWKDAAAAYEKYLKRRPDDGPIWVQFGHVLNETGDRAGAEAAYRKATQLSPDDGDALFHLRAVLRAQGKTSPDGLEDPVGQTGPTSAPLQSGPAPRRRSARPAEPLTDGTLLFAIQDLLIFLAHYVTMSGIQRVQCGISDQIIGMQDVESRFIITDQSGVLDEGTYWEIDKAALREIIHYASGHVVDHEVMRQMILAAEDAACTLTPGHGHVIVLLGCFWAHDNTVDRFLPAKRNGAAFGSYLYDIIPISHPEFCEAGLVKMFSQGLSEMCVISDFFLTISDYTRVTLEAFLRSHGSRVVPMMTVPLAHSLTGAEHTSSHWPVALRKLRGGDYVAYVSTLEGRKNHTYVVNVWRELIARGVNVPDLVFVGRRGWRVNGLFDLLEATNYLGGRVHIVHDLSDGELNAVYEHSLFTVFTSLVEGWGLPVGESLLHKRLCVASSTTSVPEVGGGFAEYVDPEDLANGIAVMERLITDREYLARRQAQIAADFVPRGWEEVARNFVDRSRILAKKAQACVPAVPLRSGDVFRPGEIARKAVDPSRYNPAARRLILNGCFYSPELWGAWMKGRSGELAFHTDLQEGDEVVVYLELREAPWDRNGAFTLEIADPRRVSGQAAVSIEVGTLHHRLQLRGRVGPMGECRVLIEMTGHYVRPSDEARDVILGLVALAYAAPGNSDARSEVLEAFLFMPATEHQGGRG